MTYKGLAKGKIIELNEPLPYCDGQAVTVSVEPNSSGQEQGSPLAILKVVRQLPDLQREDVDELERLIERGKLAVQLKGHFDHDSSDKLP